MYRNRNLVSKSLCALGILAALGWASPAASEAEIGIVMDKNADARTLTLHDGTRLEVSPRTVITGTSGQRIGFDQIPAALEKDGGREITGKEGIRYEAERRGRSVRADSIQLLESIPD